jgi:hypothetical protein
MNQEIGTKRDFPQEHGVKYISKTHEEEETNLALVHYV